MRLALEVPQPLELAEEVVERLLADPERGGDVGRPGALRSWVTQDDEICGVEVVEAALVQSLEHVPLDGLPRDAKDLPRSVP